MKKILNIVIAVMCVLGMMTGFVAGEDPTYEDGVLTMTVYEEDNSAQVIKISDGEIIESGAPSIILIMKLCDSPDGSGMKVIELSTCEVGSGEYEPFPETIVINMEGDPNDTYIDPSIVVLNLRGVQIEPDFIIPDIVVFDLRGVQIEPDVISPEIIIH